MRLLLPAAFAALGPLAVLVVPSAQPPTIPVPTYTQSVRPLLNARCVTCHRQDGPAPFSLSTYSQAKKWSGMSMKVVNSRRMPPWKPTETGIFHDENRLSKDEIATLKAWESAGSPQGPIEELVPVEKQVELPPPDKILQPARPYVVTAGAPDEYRYFVVRNPYSETKWLRSVELKPSNSRVVHHMTAFLDPTGSAERSSAASHDGQAGYARKDGGNFKPTAILGFWAPGMQPRPMPAGTAMELPPRVCIVVQVHYISTGKAETDRWSLGLRLADGPPERPMVTGLVEKLKLDIPAGVVSQEVVQEKAVLSDLKLWALMPHAHKLTKKMRAEAILPDGTKRSLIDIAEWDPAWQSLYWFKAPVSLPKGSKIRYTVTFDNSKENCRNPHQPPQDVHWGEAADDEMMLLAYLITRD